MSVVHCRCCPHLEIRLIHRVLTQVEIHSCVYVCEQDFIRAEGTYLAANKVLEKTEKELTSIAVEEGKPAWDRTQTLRFLEEKGPNGSGPEQEGKSKPPADRLRAYVIACVTAYTWSGKVSVENMTTLTKLWRSLPAGEQYAVIPPPGALLADSEDDLRVFQNATLKLNAVYFPYARVHLTQLGHTLLENLSAVRHHEGCRLHFANQAKELRAQGVRLESDNRSVLSSCTIMPNTSTQDQIPY